ncbi:Hypothetical predicted protein [Olea europaea subsp. europaea]|uniref:Uncharacterized protein n=1 Tax=Olea europaea subsp. europaea TaxID=158383 RepID=A0A8S0P942_OLEEU|nr:Hypothetical predicted protein [Olea europaea subsp. europaea]
MPPKWKPPHPINVTTRTQSNTVPSTQLEPIMQPATATQPTLATAPMETAPPLKRRHRGRTRGIGTSEIVKVTHRKLEIIYEDIDGRPTGPNASRFVSEIGTGVRIFAPLQKIFWKDLTEPEKSPIYDKVEVTIT